MNPTPSTTPRVKPSLPPSPGMLAALKLLQAARAAADDCGRDPWEFAVGIIELKGAGAGETDLRRLLVAGVAEHAHEQPRPDAGPRTFQRLADLALSQVSCFVLTPAIFDALRMVPPGEPRTVSSAMRRLVDGRALTAAEISGVRWIDVDTPEDRAEAERLLAAGAVAARAT